MNFHLSLVYVLLWKLIWDMFTKCWEPSNIPQRYVAHLQHHCLSLQNVHYWLPRVQNGAFSLIQNGNHLQILHKWSFSVSQNGNHFLCHCTKADSLSSKNGIIVHNCKWVHYWSSSVLKVHNCLYSQPMFKSVKHCLSQLNIVKAS